MKRFKRDMMRDQRRCWDVSRDEGDDEASCSAKILRNFFTKSREAV
jgi:hypothetical protein